MSSFKPYSIEAVTLPLLKVGHVVKISDNFYLIHEVRRLRKKVSLTGPLSPEKYPLTTDSNEAYTNLHGSIENERLIHIQYLSLSETTSTYLYWMEEPLLSRARDEALDSTLAALDAPYIVDKWSYSKEQHIKVKIPSGTQNLYFEIAEYRIKVTTVTPREYLRVTADGGATFISASPSPTLTRATSIPHRR